MYTKACGARIKSVGEAAADLAEGQFTALVSVFGNVDSGGDVVMPGAFKADLERWSSSGDPIPVLWSHAWDDPFAHIGTVVEAAERDDGLWVRGQIHDLDTNPKAAQIYRLLKGRRVKQFSFGYDVLDCGWGTHEGKDAFELRQLKVHEISPCLVGMNQQTELLGVKAGAG